MVSKILKRNFRLVAIGLVVLMFLYFWQKARQPLEVTVVSPVSQAFTISISAPGELKADRMADLKPLGTGKLVSLNVAAGDTVEVGQVLGAVNAVEANNNLQNAVLARDTAIAAADEIRETYGEDISWGIGYYRLKQADKAIKQTETQINVYSQQLNDKVFTAPFAGVVLDTSKLPGEVASITDTKPLLKLADLSSLYFALQVDEEDLGKVKLEQEVLIELDGLPEVKIPAKISRLSNYTVQDATGAKVIEARAAITDASKLPKIIGLSGDGEIIMEKVPEILTLPLDAVRYDNGSPYVFLVENNKISKFEVILGKENEDVVALETTIPPDVLIVQDNNKDIKVGKRVKIRE